MRPGDVVSFQLPNWWEFVALYLATVRLGAVANPLMPIFRRRELSFMLRLAESRVFIAPERFRGFDHGALARELAAELPGLKLVGLDFGSPREEFLRGARLRPDDVTQLLYTSGTTGESKGVLHTSNTLLSGVRLRRPHLRLGARDVIFMPSPLAHQLGFMYGMLMSLVLGIPIVLIDVWRAARAAQLIQAQGATFAYAATPFLADLVEGDAKLPSLRVFASAGAPIPPAVVQAARERLGLAVAASWGMTECGTVTCTRTTAAAPAESDGCALRTARCGSSTPTAARCRAATVGALQVRGASLFVGYLKRPQLYQLDAEGWFDTGDLARMDAEGYIRICGRSKDVIIRGGENIPVVEIEAALYRIPAVADAAVVAMPDPRLQERACAFVTLRSEARSSSRRFAATWRPRASPSTSGPSGSRCSPRCRAPRPGRSRSSCCGRSRRGLGGSRRSAVQRRYFSSSCSRVSLKSGLGTMQLATGQTSLHCGSSSAPTHSVQRSASIT